ncbi:unnamed protein product [Pleuronectes platessa]|uniref:Uncharacterized protein n=1 Tax=Pleuronectes platessa TaxID=8262 RepID=A0A9N7VF93_PLEPL|nr:unnamed protein product [Pleuronectes platessa]
MDNQSHPLQDTITALGSSFSNRLLHPKCLKERVQRLSSSALPTEELCSPAEQLLSPSDRGLLLSGCTAGVGGQRENREQEVIRPDIPVHPSLRKDRTVNHFCSW